MVCILLVLREPGTTEGPWPRSEAVRREVSGGKFEETEVLLGDKAVRRLVVGNMKSDKWEPRSRHHTTTQHTHQHTPFSASHNTLTTRQQPQHQTILIQRHNVYRRRIHPHILLEYNRWHYSSSVSVKHLRNPANTPGVMTWYNVNYRGAGNSARPFTFLRLKVFVWCCKFLHVCVKSIILGWHLITPLSLWPLPFSSPGILFA